MKVSSIQEPQQSFKGKQFISPKAREDLAIVIKKMKQDSIYPNKDTLIDAEIVTAVRVGDKKNLLINFLLQDTETHFLSGDKLDLKIDNETGRITKEKKPFFSRIKTFIPEVEETIDTANQNYDNSDVVTKCKITMPDEAFWKKVEGLADATGKLADAIDEYLKKVPFFRWFS